MQPASRPVYLNLFRIHLPLPGWVSILQRLSGAVLFLLTPVLLYLLQTSFDADGYTRLHGWLRTPLAKIALPLLIWVYLQHLLGGLRFLLLDSHIGTDLKTARRLSGATLIASASLALLIAGIWLW